MSFLESIFYVMWRGAAIGLIISAPMGPVGILCIQRTLDKGRRAGFFTGVGAALSDLFYCLLTGFGLSFIEEFLERNSAVIQLFGSVVLIFFGIYLFKKNPARQLRKPSEETAVSTKKSILAGFFFTFSNPLILFLIIGLFARFNFLLPELKIYNYFIGYVFIALGALAWWWIVTFFIDKVRSHFNLRSMWLINKIIGSIILIFALVGIIGGIMDLAGGNNARGANTSSIYANSYRGFDAIGGDSLVKAGECRKIAADAAANPFILRVAMTPADKLWSMTFISNDGHALILQFSNEEMSDGVSTVPVMICRAFLDGNMMKESHIQYGLDLSYGEKLLTASRRSDVLSIMMGSRKPLHLLDLGIRDLTVDSIAFTPSAEGSIAIRNLMLEVDSRRDPGSLLTPWTDTELLNSYLENSSDPMEGYWKYLDSSVDTGLVRLGGNYSFASVRSTDGYDLVYLEGAEILPDYWTEGFLKAHLSATGIPGVWEVSWNDSEGFTMKSGIRAQTDGNNDILNIQFPENNTSIRFCKILKR